MNKNKLTIIIILAVIALLHFVFIYFFFVRSSGSDKKELLVPEPTVIPPPARTMKSDEPTPVHQKKNFIPKTERFNYSNSVNGKMKSIPEMSDVRNGILVEAGTGRVLWTLDPYEAVPIASMTKMMTLLVALEQINNRNLSMDEMVTVSRTAVLVKPTIAGLRPDDQLPLKTLLQSMIVKSANDCAQTAAEYFGGGNADKFIEMMNATGARLDMKRSVFSNPHGLPEKKGKNDNRSSCEDLAILSLALMRYPEAREWVAMREVTFKEDGPKGPIRFLNHNHRLLSSKQCPGVDGIKTGFTQRAGFCIAASCERNGKRLIAVVAGCSSQRSRDELVKKLFNWGYLRLERMP